MLAPRDALPGTPVGALVVGKSGVVAGVVAGVDACVVAGMDVCETMLPVPAVMLEQAARPPAAIISAVSVSARIELTAHKHACRRRSTEAAAPAVCQAGPVPGIDRARMVDELDARLLRELDESPRVGVLELSRRLGVARGTVQARLDRLVDHGVIASFAPTLEPAALGFSVTGFATLEIRQGQGQAVLAHLLDIPEVLEVHTITGPGDMLCRVVARSNADLQRVLDRVTKYPEIVRTSTVIALSNPIRHRVLPLV
jgi:DNA-binding Lrp family transcriptional regulator